LERFFQEQTALAKCDEKIEEDIRLAFSEMWISSLHRED
jgi:hypothetical protein